MGIKEVEYANIDIKIETKDPILITLDGDYAGKIKIKIKDKKGNVGLLRIPVQLDKESVEFFKELGLYVYEHCGLNVYF
ncbi:MAG: hypothetical protein ACFFDT_00315 [Candidatus Hodarchaeota archaeon]